MKLYLLSIHLILKSTLAIPFLVRFENCTQTKRQKNVRENAIFFSNFWSAVQARQNQRRQLLLPSQAITFVMLQYIKRGHSEVNFEFLFDVFDLFSALICLIYQN